MSAGRNLKTILRRIVLRESVLGLLGPISTQLRADVARAGRISATVFRCLSGAFLYSGGWYAKTVALLV
jgi:hypothetical protein